MLANLSDAARRHRRVAGRRARLRTDRALAGRAHPRCWTQFNRTTPAVALRRRRGGAHRDAGRADARRDGRRRRRDAPELRLAERAVPIGWRGGSVPRAVGREDRVAVFGERGAGWLTFVLGILKAGAAFVPLDPLQPDARLASIVSSSGVRVMACGSGVGGQGPDAGALRAGSAGGRVLGTRRRPASRSTTRACGRGCRPRIRLASPGRATWPACSSPPDRPVSRRA